MKSAVIDAVVGHARNALPEECCGMLIGSGDRIDEAVAARNIAAERSTRFLIDPKNHLDALRDARRRGLDVVGFYHSHPRSAPVPSAVDVAEASYPDYLYLIVGDVADAGSVPAVRLYRLSGGNFLPLPFVTEP